MNGYHALRGRCSGPLFTLFSSYSIITQLVSVVTIRFLNEAPHPTSKIITLCTDPTVPVMDLFLSFVVPTIGVPTMGYAVPTKRRDH